MAGSRLKKIIIPKSSSVVPSEVNSARADKYNMIESFDSPKYQKLDDNDGVIIFNGTSIATINSLISSSVVISKPMLVISSPLNHSSWQNHLSKFVGEDVQSKFFLLILCKLENFSFMKNGQDPELIIQTILSFLNKTQDSFKIIIKPHPLDYTHPVIEKLSKTVKIYTKSPALLAPYAKRIFFLGPTNLVGILAKYRKIDLSSYCDFNDLYGGLSYINVSDTSSPELVKLISDDLYFDMNVSARDVRTLIGDPVADMRRIERYLSQS